MIFLNLKPMFLSKENKHTGKVPDFLAEALRLLTDEYTTLLHIYKQYRQLFGHSEKRVELLNKSAPSFFEVVQICLFDIVLLGISKLLGPAKSKKNKNATLEWLEVLIKNNDPKAFDLQKKLELRRSEIKIKAANISKNRRKRIAHSDRKTTNYEKYYPFAISRKDITNVMYLIAEYFNTIYAYYADSTASFDISSDGEAEYLLYLIAHGIRYKELVKKGLIDSKYNEENPWIQLIGKSIQDKDYLEDWTKVISPDD